MDLYEAIFARRDIRKFVPKPLPQDALQRILEAAHHAGSVGFMQPWDFILVRDLVLRHKVKQVFEEQNRLAAAAFSGERKTLYESLKLEGILEAPLNICVTCDRSRGGQVLGRHSIMDTDMFSTCCAVQNLWLAARAEGIGVGWVSIVENAALSEILGIPGHVVPLAYLCVGYPEEFAEKPMLETVGWRQRTPLAELVFEDRYGNKA
jgi:5,6-dimethylbenzimidazole synthase